jgi:hypothetical protein|tara:strand:- start:1119 stop:1415 length:297 start_codon:yes stop_codon:yes gene_type:complete
MLEETIDLLGDREVLTGCLRECLDGGPIEKPADHHGGELADMYRLALAHHRAVHIVAVVREAAVTGRTSGRTRERGLGGFRQAWEEYQRFLESGGLQQ